MKQIKIFAAVAVFATLFFLSTSCEKDEVQPETSRYQSVSDTSSVLKNADDDVPPKIKIP